MYALPALEPANKALWASVRAGLLARGLVDTPEQLDTAQVSVPDEITRNVLFTQVCGFPLFRRYRGQAVLLGTPCYDAEGCAGATHRGAFIVRAADKAPDLAAMRGCTFGCNSINSNTGMNLPRLSLARIAAGTQFFSRIVWTGAHLQSLRLLAAGEIDLCSVDCVTWAFVVQHLPEWAGELRVLEWTEPSPCLPFVTAIATPHAQIKALRSALHEVFAATAAQPALAALRLRGLAPLTDSDYDVLSGYEIAAAQLGYPVLT